MPTSQYEIPRFGTDGRTLLGWLKEAEQEGKAWLNAQRPTTEWKGAIEALSAPTGADRVNGMSNLQYRKVKRIARELVASLSAFRHEGEFKTTWNQALYDQAHTLTNLDRNLYRKTGVYAAHREAIQYGVATGTAYLIETWDPHYHSPHRGDIRLSSISPNDVYFIQLPRDHNIQNAYAVIWREELPINLAKKIYGRTNAAFAAMLTPDRQEPGWLAKGLQKVQQFVSPALRVAGRMPADQQGSFPTVDIFHMYTVDTSLNDGPAPIPMGTLGTNWSYTVPALGDEIPTGVINKATQEEFTRPAKREDTLMFPLRRYTIFSNTGVCYDGSSPWWHAAAPIARLRFGDWSWEALGSSMVADVVNIEEGVVALMRMIEDSAAARLDPPMLYDDTLVSDTWVQKVNPRLAGGRAKAPLSMGDPIKFPVPPEYYNVPNYIPEWIQSQEDRMDYITGVRDLVAIAKAKQVPGADTLEKLMEMAGPLVQDMVRAVESPLAELGEWRKSYYFQFYTRARMITVTGPEGVDVDQEYRPEQLLASIQGENPQQRAERGFKALDDFHYHVSESGINEIHRMTTKLFYTQLMDRGFPISPWTFAKVAQIPNFGPTPEGTNTEMERWIAWKRIEMDLQIELAQSMAAGQQPPMPDAGEIAAPGQERPGRPPSFNAPPRLEQKDGGTRSTISTSR